MKLKIKAIPTRTPGLFYWCVTTDKNTTNYSEYAGAYEYAKKYLKRYHKECSAYSMVQTLAFNLLESKEFELCKKLLKNKCKGITPKQYGYLKGIHERQKREW